MKKLIIVTVLSLALGVGYFIYQQSSSLNSLTSSSTLAPKLNISQVPLDVTSLKQVLGEATSTVLDTSNNIINQVTDGDGGPVINEAIETIQKEIQEIPQEQYDKLKYEFCQGIIEEYESN